MYNKWNFPCNTIVQENNYNFSLHEFKVYDERGLVAIIIPDTLEQMNDIVDKLNSGKCPLCEGWKGCMVGTLSHDES